MHGSLSLQRRAVGCGTLKTPPWTSSVPSVARPSVFRTSFALSFVLLGLLLGASPAAAEVVGNAAGRYDTVVLRNLGNHTAAVVCMVADGGAFTPQELWRSKAGTFDVNKAKFVVGDVNGDGIADGIVLYDLGHARSRLYVFLSNGQNGCEAHGLDLPQGWLRLVARQAHGRRPQPRRPRRRDRPV